MSYNVYQSTYTKEDIDTLFSENIKELLPGQFCDNLVRKMFINNDTPKILKNKARELFNIVDRKDIVSEHSAKEYLFPLYTYFRGSESDVTPGSVIQADNIVLVSPGYYIGDFFIDEDSNIVSLIKELLYYCLNDMRNDAYAMLNLLSTTVRNYSSENRYMIPEASLSNRRMKIHPMEL